MPRTLTKLLPELGIALAITAVSFALDNPELGLGSGVLVMLQALRRVLRDMSAGQPQ